MCDDAFEALIVCNEFTCRFLTYTWYAGNIIRFVSYQPFKIRKFGRFKAVAGFDALFVVFCNFRNSPFGNFDCYMLIDKLQGIHIAGIDDRLNTLLHSLHCQSA